MGMTYNEAVEELLNTYTLDQIDDEMVEEMMGLEADDE